MDNTPTSRINNNILPPPEAYFYFPKDDEVKIGAGPAGLRKIYEGQIEYDEFENDFIQAFLEQCVKANIDLDSYWKKWHILRLCQASRFNMELAMEMLKQNQEWRAAKLPITINSKIEALLKTGALYVHGRDNRFRPILVIRPGLIDQSIVNAELLIETLSVLLEFIIDNMFLPGQVENWGIIIDLEGFGFFSGYYGLLQEIMNFVRANYRSRLYKMYVVNAPFSVYVPWRVAKAFLSETTVKKIFFCRDSRPVEIKDHVHPEQLEERYGGIAPNLTQYWPASAPISKSFFTENDDPTTLLVSKKEYHDMASSGILRNNKLSPAVFDPMRFTKSKAEGEGGSDVIDDNDTDEGSPSVIANRITEMQRDLGQPKLKIGIDEKYEIFYDFHDQYSPRVDNTMKSTGMGLAEKVIEFDKNLMDSS